MKPKIGLALGSGSARGWAHIGVIRALEQAGVQPHIVCGTSIGALVGAVYVEGELDSLEEWVTGLTWQTVVGFLDVSLVGGLIKGERLVEFFRRNFADADIADLPRAYSAVATDLESGNEVWLREGRVMDAVRASIALPGLFTPVQRDGRILVDGGLVNPVPVSLCRAMGADVVIAVDLNADLLGRHLRRLRADAVRAANGEPESWLQRVRESLAALHFMPAGSTDAGPSMLEVVASSINIMQVRITRSRLAGEPADLLITPQLAHIGLMEFHRAREAVAAGRRATEHVLPRLRELTGSDI
ncbi:patatin-like phospholipase RssA [Pelomicrobium methylotrophicum]|uniref:Patatin-like phospholipase RssA n=1 Tax=Pelomicrobium methylotrophicum TaxID=2602750 RepID=A0A5C7EH71_9PROT|nr:patatin-like phospholipase RssA [Pelomicrobium methylotrophicum]TXF11376.1 patatin-like phospholipase RssA [Pelomicrobium methylotrophicum]